MTTVAVTYDHIARTLGYVGPAPCPRDYGCEHCPIALALAEIVGHSVRVQPYDWADLSKVDFRGGRVERLPDAANNWGRRFDLWIAGREPTCPEPFEFEIDLSTLGLTPGTTTKETT